MLSFELMTQAASVQSATRESRFLKDARCVKMSFPTLLVRPNEKNPKVLRCHEFLRQSNQLVEKNLINTEGRKMLAKMLTKMVVEVKGIYALDEKCAELAKSGKLLEKLKMSHQTSISVMEDRCALADLSRQVQEKKLVVQRKYYECDHFRKSVQAINAEIRREKEMNEKRLSNTSKATEELVSKSASILKLLENSADVTKLRTMEEEKRILEEKVNNLRLNKKVMADDILTKKATLKAESKRSFKRTLIECAKHYKLCESLTPKLEKSMKNLELLRDEEESRRASGCLDETMQFDRSFVLASMSKDESPGKISQVQPSGNDTNTQQKHVTVSGFIGSVLEQRENRMEVDENHVSDIPIDTSSSKAAAKEHELVSQDVIPATPIPPVCRDTMVMDTQEVETRETSPEPEEEDAEGEKQLNRSLDVMDVDEDGDEKEEIVIEPEENDETNFFKSSVNTESPVSSKPANPAMSIKKQVALSKPCETGPIETNANNREIESPNDANLRLDEEELLSENVSNRSNNFSFNFFENNKGEDNGGVNGSENDSDGQFDFNFGGISAGDDGSNNGSGGGFDFLAVEDEGQGSGNMASDPFGFGSNAGETGGGDVSFNFNFDGDNDGGATSGADGNGTSFFNF